jgi:hypothetical protein
VVVAVAACSLMLWALAWVRVGADTRDGGFAVALQLRVAQGDMPFRDEFNPVVLGALPGAPFVWLWHEWFGLTGLVLASRVFFVLVAAGVMFLAYRGLRESVTAPAAFAGIAVATLALPYGIPVLSYNTIPVLGSVLSASAFAATVATGSRRWAALSGAALGVAALSNPQYLPTGLVLGVVSIAWLERQLWSRLLAAAAAPLVAFGVWALLVPGLNNIRTAVHYLRETRALVLPADQRLRNNLENLYSQLTAPSYLVVVSAAAVVTVLLIARPRSRLAAAGLALLPIAALLPVLRMAWRTVPAGTESSLTSTGEIGVTTLHGAAMIVSVLFVPGMAWLARARHRALTAATTYAVGLGVLMTPIIASSTASGPSRAVAAVGLSTPVLMLTVMAVHGACRSGWFAGAAGLGAVMAMVGIATATSFPGVPPVAANESITSGAWAGMSGRPVDASIIRTMQTALDRVSDPGDRVLAVASPSYPLFSDVRAETPMLWIAFWGDANRDAVEWLRQPGHRPDVVLVYGYDGTGLSSATELRRDPLAAYIREGFSVVESSTSPAYTILRNVRR